MSQASNEMNLSFAPISEIRRIRAEAQQRKIDPILNAKILADLFRLNTLYMIRRAGSGHIGSSFSCMDIITWLWTQEMRNPNEPLKSLSKGSPSDTYFSSKGHDAPGLYSLLLGLEKLPEEKMHHLRRLGGLPGHPDVHVPYMITNTGSLGMGISKARGMAIARRLSGQEGRLYVLTGDGELQEGQIWESLLPTANYKFNEITVIVDHNKFQSDTWVSKVSDLGDLEKRFAAHGWEVARCDGHDFTAIKKTLAHFKTIKDRPQILIADTIKGKGVSFMQATALGEDEWRYLFHSGAPSLDNFQKAIDELSSQINKNLNEAGLSPLRLDSKSAGVRPMPANGQKLVSAYGEELLKVGQENEKVVVLDADLVLDTGLIPFMQKFPKRFVECGIAEMDMVSQAGGLALSGYLPVVHSFACFLTTRPNEQIYNNATEASKIIYVGSLAGMLPPGPGHSHQSVRDISAIGGMPNLTLVQPSTAREAQLALRWAAEKNDKSTYIRLVTIPVDVPFELPSNYTLTKGHGVALTEGNDVALIAYGPVMLAQAYKAAEILKAKKISTRVINLPWLNFIDPTWFKKEMSSVATVVSLDDHYEMYGQGTLIGAMLSKAGLAGKKFLHRGLTDVPACGWEQEVLEHHKLDAASIADWIQKQ